MPGPSIVGELAIRVRGQMDQFRTDVQKEADRTSKSFGEKFRSDLGKIGTATAGLVGAGIGSAAFEATQAWVAFDDRMREIFSIMPGITQQAMDQMQSDIRRVAVETGKSAEEVASGVYDAISSGIDPSQVTGFIEIATKAAAAGLSDTKDAAAVLAATLNSYSLDASHAEEVADTLFQTVKVGVTTFPELAAEMALVSPVASVMGVDLKQTTAALAAMTLQGHDTASAATDIQAVFTLLQKGTPGLTKVLKEMGYESGQAALDSLGFQGTLEMLREGADRLGIAIPKMTGRVQAAQAIFALTGDKAEGARQVLESYEDTTGNVTEAFQTMEGGIGGTVRHIQAQIHDALIGIGKEIEPLAPIFMAFGPQIGRWIGAGAGAIIGVLGKYLAGPAIRAAVAGAGMIAGKAYGLALMAGAKAAALTGQFVNALSSSPTLVTAGSAAGKLFGIAFKVAVVAAAALVWVEVFDQFNKFWDKVDEVNAARIAKTKAAIGTGVDETITALSQEAGRLSTIGGDLFGLNRLVEDTTQGQQIMENLAHLGASIVHQQNLTADQIVAGAQAMNEAAREAYARGNTQVGDTLTQYATELEDRLWELPPDQRATQATVDQINASTKMIDDAIASGTGDVAETAGEGGDQIQTALDVGAKFLTAFQGWQQGIKAGFEGAVHEVKIGFGSIKNALANPPQLISRADRLENMEGRMRKVMRNLHKAVKAEDPAAIDYWTSAAIAQRQRMDAMKNRTTMSVDDIRRAFDAAGVDIDGTWLDIQHGAETTRGKVNKTGDAVDALPTKHTTTIVAETGVALDRITAFRGSLGDIPRVIHTTIQQVINTVQQNANAPRPGGWDGNPATPWPRAMGGPVTAGVPYLVGEKRAEIFVPTVNGRIEPDASRAMGPTINLAVHGLPMRAQTPTEVAMQAARAARLGYFEPPRMASRFAGVPR